MARLLHSDAFSLVSPAVFPSVSSLRVRAPIPEHFTILKASGFGQALVSAADLHSLPHEEREFVREWCRDAADDGWVVMLDSGGYEAFWKEWDWSQEELSAVSDVPVALRLAMDARWQVGDEVQALIERALESCNALERHSGAVVPVVRAPLPQLAEAVVGIVEAGYSPMIAVAERDLGWGILERCSSIGKLRKALDTVDPGCFLHVLGAGNPHDILAYWISGADSFDGLEWCRATIEPGTLEMACLSRWQLIAPRSVVGAEAEELGYFHGMALSNLVELRQFASRLGASSLDEAVALARNLLPSRLATHLIEVGEG